MDVKFIILQLAHMAHQNACILVIYGTTVDIFSPMDCRCICIHDEDPQSKHGQMTLHLCKGDPCFINECVHLHFEAKMLAVIVCVQLHAVLWLEPE